MRHRIDEIVTFHSLGREQIAQIVDIQLKDLQRRLADRKLTLELTDDAKAQLAERGYDPVFTLCYTSSRKDGESDDEGG